METVQPYNDTTNIVDDRDSSVIYGVAGGSSCPGWVNGGTQSEWDSTTTGTPQDQSSGCIFTYTFNGETDHIV